jgi:pimeloyl-ACP methyl ester carboxylesterase
MKRTLLFLGITALLGACSSVGVESQSLEEGRARERRDALTGALSERSERALYRLDLLDRYREAPDKVLDELDRRLIKEGQRSVAYVLAEGCTLEAARCEDPAKRARYLGATASYAWAYLFDTGLGPAPSPFDPRYRGACDLYNQALSRLIDLRGKGARGEGFVLPTLRKAIVVRPGAHELAWKVSEFEAFESTDRYRPVGLSVVNRAYGIGAPCLAFHTRPKGDVPASDHYLPILRQTYAATVLIRFQGTIRERDRPGSTYSALGEIYDPMRRLSVEIAGREVPLESDLTTPIAHFLDQVPQGELPTSLLDVEELEKHRLGLVMLQPFQPDKIPVVFVHGLMSNPLTWIPMLNGLLGDVALRERYQFLFFSYPTGNPLLVSADHLRTSLDAFVRRYDPQGHNPRLQRMVLVGHSMGGVISRYQVQDSTGGELWAATSRKPLDSLEVSEDLRATLRRTFYFRPRPYVRRVVFLASPHRGSSVAQGVVGALGSAFVTLPTRTLSRFTQLAKALGREEMEATGIEGLSPENPVLRASMSLPISERVTYHSIVGNTEAADTPQGSDGIVPYLSSRLKGASSELIVRSGHSVQQTPRAVAEVGRILHRHR